MLGLRNRQVNADAENVGAGTRSKQQGAQPRNTNRMALRDVNRLVKRNPSLNPGLNKKPLVTRSNSLSLACKPDPCQSISTGIVTRNQSRKSGESLLPGIGEVQSPTVENVAISSQLTAIAHELQPDSYSTGMIPDIDKDDVDNPQLASVYVNDIYKYLSWLENDQSVEENYLGEGEITPKMRAILVDWIVQVHIRFHLLSETLYMTIMLLDRFLGRKRVAKDQLQLVGVTCMFVASKFEEMYAPEVNDFVYITDNTYTKRDILLCEMQILGTLEFKLGRPLPIHFLRRFSKAADVDGETHTMAKYLLEMSLTDYSQCHVAPSLVAAGALHLAMRLVDGNVKWTRVVAHYSGYDEMCVLPVVRKMAHLAWRTHSLKNKLQAVRNKYQTTKFMQMSKHDSLNDVALLESLSQ